MAVARESAAATVLLFLAMVADADARVTALIFVLLLLCWGTSTARSLPPAAAAATAAEGAASGGVPLVRYGVIVLHVGRVGIPAGSLLISGGFELQRGGLGFSVTGSTERKSLQ